MKKVLVLAGVAGMVAANANAIDMTPYVGLDASYSVVKRDHSDTQISSKNWALAGVLGARTDHYGVEAFYQPGMQEKKGDVKTRLTSYGVDLLGFQPLGCSGRWEGVVSAGIGEYDVRGHVDDVAGFKDHGFGYRLGAGLQYALTDTTAVRAMYHHAWINKSHVDATDEISLGVRYSF